MSAYQHFLDFFSIYNKERLDGLSESYFTPMTPNEREMAFDYLLALVEKGGTEESVNGLFRADPSRALIATKRCLESGVLRGDAQIAAAWNICQIEPNENLLPIFINLIASADPELREKAAYYVPAALCTSDLDFALRGMIRTETHKLARIHAVDKLLECHGATKESLGKDTYRSLYMGLHSDDMEVKEGAFRQLDALT